MFKVPTVSTKDVSIYNKVKFAFLMETVEQWADSRGKDLTQEQAEKMADDLFDNCYADEIEYLDDFYGEKQ